MLANRQMKDGLPACLSALDERPQTESIPVQIWRKVRSQQRHVLKLASCSISRTKNDVGFENIKLIPIHFVPVLSNNPWWFRFSSSSCSLLFCASLSLDVCLLLGGGGGGVVVVVVVLGPHPSPFHPVTAPSSCLSSPATDLRKQFLFQSATCVQNWQFALRSHSNLHSVGSLPDVAMPPPPSDSDRSPPTNAMLFNVHAANSVHDSYPCVQGKFTHL